MARRQTQPNSPGSVPASTSSASSSSKEGAAVPGELEAADSVERLSFDRAVGELEEILERIESGSIGLEESLRQFQRGNSLVRRCRAILDAAELQVREIAMDDEGGAEASEATDDHREDAP